MHRFVNIFLVKWCLKLNATFQLWEHLHCTVFSDAFLLHIMMLCICSPKLCKQPYYIANSDLLSTITNRSLFALQVPWVLPPIDCLRLSPLPDVFLKKVGDVCIFMNILSLFAYYPAVCYVGARS